METTTETMVPEHYNPNQLVTYKVIGNAETTYPTTKVVNIEYALHLGRTAQEALNNKTSQIRRLEDSLVDWIENDNSAEEIVAMICDNFGFSVEKEIEFEATASITGRVRVPFAQLADFDIGDVDLTVYADSHSYDVDVDVEIDFISTV